MKLSIGDRVFYTKSTGLWIPAKVLAFCTMGMWSWSMIKVVCGSSIIDAPCPSPLVSLDPHCRPGAHDLTVVWGRN